MRLNILLPAPETPGIRCGGPDTASGYSLCLLERLQDALRRRDIWLENSDRWGNPREKLLQGEEWQAQRVPVCRALGHPTDGHKGVQQLAVQLDETRKPSHPALKEMRRFIFAMTVNILP